MPAIYVLGGTDVGERFVVHSGDTLGRVAECDIVVRHRSVSRKHARLEKNGDHWVVTDLDSRNGIRVGGSRVKRGRLDDDTEFVLGDLPLRFRLEEAELPAWTEPVEAKPKSAPAVGGAGFELEEDITLDDLAPRRSTAPAPPSALDVASQRRAEILRAGDRPAGLWTGDLSQQPAWVRWAVGLLATVAFAGFVYAAYRGVLFVRGE